MLGSFGFFCRFLSSLPLLPLLLWLAAGTGARSCCMFFDDSTMLPHPPPPPHPEGFFPQTVWLAFLVFFSLASRLSAPREKEQANRAHHTLHVCVVVMLFWSCFCEKNTAIVFTTWYLAAFGSICQRFSGELAVIPILLLLFLLILSGLL